MLRKLRDDSGDNDDDVGGGGDVVGGDDGVDDGDGDGDGDGDVDQNSMKIKETDHPQMTVLSLQVGEEEIFKSLSLN